MNSWIRNIKTDKTPIIIHASGDSKKHNLFKMLRSINGSILAPKNTTIVTFSDKNGPGLLETQLNNNNIKYVRVEMNHSYHPNPFYQKISSFQEIINNINSDFMLVLDNFDVWIDGDLNELKNKVEKENYFIFFGAEKEHWPPEIKTFETEKHIGRGHEYKFLNAGVYFGRTDFIKYLLSSSFIKDPISDQEHLKIMYERYYPLIVLDMDASLIGNLNNAEHDFLFNEARFEKEKKTFSGSEEYFATHKDWRGKITLGDNLLFYKDNEICGTWILKEGQLSLNWYDWDVDILTRKKDEFIGKYLKMVKR